MGCRLPVGRAVAARGVAARGSVAPIGPMIRLRRPPAPGDVLERRRPRHPVLAVLPALLLPDRHGRLHGVDAVAGRVEGSRSVSTRHGDDHGRLADSEPTDAVEESDSTDLGMVSAGGPGNIPQPGSNPFDVRLVLDGVDAVPTFCVVPHRPDEHHDRPTVRADDPVLHGIDRQRLGRELDPLLAHRACGHDAMLEPPPSDAYQPRPQPRPSRTPDQSRRRAVGILRVMAEAPGAPSDPDGEDDPVRPPLPPEDRLWRHPSEAARHAGGTTPRLFPAPPPPPPTRPRHRDLGLAGLVGVVVGALAVTVGTALASHHHRPGAEGHGRTPSTTAALGAAGSGTAIVGAHLDDAVRALSPALVAIEAAGDGWARSGTGIVVGHSRFILTALPVVAGARTVEVTTSTGIRVTARVVGTDPDLGLALLDAPLPTPTAARLVATPLPQVGTMTVTVAAAGSPGDPLLSVGTITTTGTTAAVVGHDVGSLIETSAPLPAGGVGGALLGESGALEGLVLATSPSADGLVSLAVPISAVRQALPSLEAGSRPETGWLGIDVALSTSTGSPTVVITRVAPDSPAAAGGLRSGQAVLAVNGVKITGVEQLEAAVQAEPPGTRIVLDVRTRSGRSTRLAIRLGRAPEPPPSQAPQTASGG